MKDKFQDAINFSRKLTWKKAANGLSLTASYYLSRLIGKPFISGQPFGLSIESTTHCNLRCPQCPSGLRSFTRDTGLIDPENFRRLIDDMAGTLCHLNFYFQGEPYLHPKFLDMVAYAENKKIYTTTSTNAHFLDEKNAKETVGSGLSRIIISMDGLDQESYEKYRIGGSLEKVKTGIRNLVRAKEQAGSRKPYIIVQFLVMKHNESDAETAKDFAKGLGANRTNLKTLQVYDHTNGSELIPLRETNSRYRKGEDGRYHIKNRFYNHCWKMWHSSVITWDGYVVPCCFDKDAQHVLGNVFEKPFGQVWLDQKYQNFRKNLFASRKSIDICRNCTEGTKVWI